MAPTPTRPRPAAAQHPFVDHCLELLAPLGSVRARRMFGGHGIYLDELFVAIVSGEQLYLKGDAQSRAAFEAAGCAPFSYEAQGHKMTSLQYWRAPEEAMESPALMQPWARRALEAALRARAAPKRRALTPPAAPSGAGGGRASAKGPRPTRH